LVFNFRLLFSSIFIPIKFMLFNTFSYSLNHKPSSLHPFLFWTF
jgi:hypothetical protein